MANAWECDEYGHLNVRGYVEKADEAFASLAADLGQPPAATRGVTSALRATQLHVRYIGEARPGDMIDIEGAPTVVERDALTAAMVMRHTVSGAIAAGFTVRARHVAAPDGRVFPWPRRVHAAAEAAVADAPSEAGPRGLSADPWDAHATIDRADALKLVEVGRGIFLPDETDALGVVRPGAIIGRLSDSVGRIIGPSLVSDADGLGVALMEARFDYRRWPRAGDRYIWRSGVIGFSGKGLRVGHWMLNPDDGSAWCLTEGFAMTFDLSTRRAAPPPDALRASIETSLRPGLAD